MRALTEIAQSGIRFRSLQFSNFVDLLPTRIPLWTPNEPQTYPALRLRTPQEVGVLSLKYSLYSTLSCSGLFGIFFVMQS